jgi:hypothetical protein
VFHHQEPHLQMSFHVHLRRHRRREVHNRDHKATRQTPEQSPYMRCDIHQRVPYIYLIQDPSRSHSVSYSDYMVRSTSGSKHPSEVEGCLVPHVAKVCSNSFRIPISSCAMCYVLCAMCYVLCAMCYTAVCTTRIPKKPSRQLLPVSPPKKRIEETY